MICIAAKLTKPLMMGRMRSSAWTVVGSVWIPWLINVRAGTERALFRSKGCMGEGKEVEEAFGTKHGVEELPKSLCVSL